MKRKTMAEVADQSAQNIASAQSEREALRGCNRAIHAAGGPQRAVWDALAAGATLSDIAERVGVSYRTLTRWLATTEERKDLYRQARKMAAGRLAEDTLGISDGATQQDVQVARLRVDTRRWLASRYDPDTFGERQVPTVAINLQQLRIDALRYLEALDSAESATEAANRTSLRST
jgi:AcrR family transcriptional regulator